MKHRQLDDEGFPNYKTERRGPESAGNPLAYEVRKFAERVFGVEYDSEDSTTDSQAIWTIEEGPGHILTIHCLGERFVYNSFDRSIVPFKRDQRIGQDMDRIKIRNFEELERYYRSTMM